MMRQMRDNVKWIMALTAVTFVGLMVFGWGMDITGRSGAQATGGEIGRVNGEPVTYQEWQSVLQNLTNQQQGGPLSVAQQRQLEEQAWNQVVMTKLVGQELRRNGIDVTSAEIRQAARFAPPPEIMENEAFKTNGQFDLNKYHAFLASPGADDQLLQQLELYYRELIPRSKLFYQATTASYLPDGELWRMFRDSKETAQIRYIVFDPARLVPDARVSVTDREIEQYYRENKEKLQRPATAKIKFVTLSRTPSAADTAAARAHAQQVRQELVSSGNWRDIVRRESSDSASHEADGAYKNVTKGRMVPAFDAALWSLPVNQISEPIATQFGYHIMQVTRRQADTADVRHVLIPIRLSEERENQLLELADSLETLGANGSLESAARALNLQVGEGLIGEPVPQQPMFVPGLGMADDAGVWVFDGAQVGEVSDVFETPTSFYMVELVEKTEKGTLPLAQAKPQITATLLQEKKLAEARLIARKALDQIRSGSSLDQAAQSAGLTVQAAGPFTRMDFVPGMGRANAAVGTAFGLKPNQISGIVEAEGALFIIQTLQRTEPARQEFEAQKVAQRQQINQALTEQRWNLFLDALRKNAKIIDNRKEVLTRGNATTTAQ